MNESRVLSDQAIEELKRDCLMDAEAGKMSNSDLQIVLDLVETIEWERQQSASLVAELDALEKVKLSDNGR